jgi:hypothetical protein
VEESFDYKEETEANSEQEFDKVLRPKSFSDFTGQPSIIENLDEIDLGGLNKYGDGFASQRILNFIQNLDFDKLLYKKSIF